MGTEIIELLASFGLKRKMGFSALLDIARSVSLVHNLGQGDDAFASIPVPMVPARHSQLTHNDAAFTDDHFASFSCSGGSKKKAGSFGYARYALCRSLSVVAAELCLQLPIAI